MIVIFLIVFWSLRILSNLMSYIQLWYIKEYRFDRMWIHLRTPQGKRWLFIPFRRMRVSPKTISLFIFSLSSLIIGYRLFTFSWWGRLLILDVLTFPIVSFWVMLLRLPTLIYHELLIYLATKKLRRHKFKSVIGITGSFGKTSTKEFLATILNQKYQVLKTAASQNSAIGIAELILNQLKPTHEILIVEMGAYKVGEIARMCRIVRPQIGIVTAINAQHQDLFQSLKNTFRAKYELIASLPSDGTAIFNADNEYTLKMAKQAQKTIKQILLYTKADPPERAEVQILQAKKVKATFETLEFAVSWGKETARVKVPILGEHQISNILAAIAGAIASGMSLTQAARGANQIKAISKTMQKIGQIKGATLIDDTFNNNPDAARAAIKFLGQTPGKRILVFQPMIELGTHAELAHEEVGKLASQYCDQVYLTNSNYFEAFNKGVKSGLQTISVRVIPPQKAAVEIKSQLTTGDTVIFKGKEAERVLKELIKSV
ncbi:MAG: UDP-N-acetylmuramoyl-tripeptide-D-alanyl-D-alanine ligase [Candidatus Gottesmanbacteria bacterium GW2011_GWB1_43_11]|uniref:UDP-N-acetylmuramoyl-tripeptide-D-alanyl-D-alanine ligase n=1 Tax=Candidatus Gottesmanbacteria bacterium GW2011_GWB1_43_11 TaxID=1618446 RepID=A0A0G1FKT9_9BACT|nr:MAG: UDP-N-acetylmuramoyl-tripeptide-D-alanyl-D-alanine ligase [Candidatus Gottesmanbacteria bacterium GW2011_GWA2_42_16]KKS56326.1 MAG: UDP-N-acetylmuramoyl-tripeptide-D-alanyl-D-alanine ligase [Candidatus Gottesmanbacteria bacterium GW2011_GWA1_42_26]KKS82334.1 MAG: UDP-N-acetylmuramoyl-tripeptide-D-alanyl-D-alanine ligase [Candidatus Gottesmanbacteria bacterium GW2011_GWC1_43_10]KKS87528.1 MAG: UDP-N-acetylmuramoyl-tripeptide-D-alanyl-D-alanine ligase [Candidatus Gottesmanbacteria bacteriu